MSVPATRSSSGSAVCAVDGGLVGRRSRRSVPSSISRSVDAGRVVDDLGRLVGLVLRRDEDLGLAVAQDVRQLAARQPRRRRGVDRAGVVAAPGHLEVAGVVLHAERHVVAGLHAGGPQQAGRGGWRRRRARRTSCTAPVAAMTIAGLSGWRGDVGAGVHGDRTVSDGTVEAMDAGAEQFARLERFADARRRRRRRRAARPGRAGDRRRPARRGRSTARSATLDELAAGCPAPTFDGLRRYLLRRARLRRRRRATTTTRATRSSTSCCAPPAGCRSCWPR